MHLSGLVTELSCGREQADMYGAGIGHNESSEEEGEEDDGPDAISGEAKEDSEFNEFVAKHREAQQQKGK